jgi:hypothetical protein
MWSSFSRSEWLCCSLVAPNAHSWPENLLTLHLIYHLFTAGNLTEGSTESAPIIELLA